MKILVVPDHNKSGGVSMLKFGEKVRFSKYLRKKCPAVWVDIDNLSKKHMDELYENDYIEIEALETAHCGNQEGLVVGKREMVQKRKFYVESQPHTGAEKLDVYSDYIDVYLIANNLRGFYRVPEEWIEEIGQ